MLIGFGLGSLMLAQFALLLAENKPPRRSNDLGTSAYNAGLPRCDHQCLAQGAQENGISYKRERACH